MSKIILNKPNQKIFFKLFRTISILLFILPLSLTNTDLKEDESNLELIFVYQHIRHGARGPQLVIILFLKMVSTNFVFLGKVKEMEN